MANTLQNLEMGQIYINPLNQRSMDADEIEIIKESILEVGLLHPLAVYQESEDRYILVSGHKRYEALKALGRTGHSVVSCMVVDRPCDETREAELLARANVHRSSPEQVKKEVELVSTIWNCMETGRRNVLTERYKKAFIEEYQNDPRYIADASEFLSNRFRPRLDYIRHITGLSVSNRTISTYLKDTLKKENEGIESDPKTKERAITEKVLLRSIESLSGLIDGYKNSHKDIPKSLENLELVLKDAEKDLM